MGKSKLLIYILTVLLLCAAIFGGVRESADDRPLYALVTTSGGAEELSVWYDSYNGVAYIFLPGYAELDQVQLKTSRDGAYQIGPHSVADGMTCNVFTLDEVYPVSAPEGFPYRDRKLVFVRSGGVSTLHLDLQSGNMAHLHADKTHSEPGSLRLYSEDGTLQYSGNADSVSGRGQSSWLEEKKSYNFTLQREADLLGMGSAQKWVLQANAKDPSNLRNKLVFDFAAKAGLAYTPDSQWVDLYLNGEYAGLYLLCERIEVHPERVNVSGHDSFLVKQDSVARFEAQGSAYFSTDGNTTLEILHASGDYATLRELWQSAENAILAENGIDPVRGVHYQDLIDTNSWVRKFLLEETFGNLDAPLLSQYYYMDASRENNRIFAGPAWDYDLSFAGTPNQIFIYRDLLYSKSWYHALYQKPEFQQLLKDLYAGTFQPLLLQTVENDLDRYAYQISRAASVNATRWYSPAPEDQIANLKDYLRQRLSLLDSLWLQDQKYVTVRVVSYTGYVNAYLVVPGSCLPDLDGSMDKPGSWYYSDTDTPIDPTAPVYDDTTVFFRVDETAETTVSQEEEAVPLPRSRFLAVLVFLMTLPFIIACELVLHHKRKPKANHLSERIRCFSEELYDKTK